MNLSSLSALVPGAGVESQGAMPAALSVPVTDVMVLLTRKPNVSLPDLMKVLPEEARETMLLYLEGKINHWYSRADGKGVVFFLRCSSIEEAEAMMGALPLDKAGMVDLEFIPVGPLVPMRLLTRLQTGDTEAK
ncbi:hypothetical protein [Edaphobacter sp. 12200R-103]|jgi:hypothetical protein|uniref:hypothetical protein n=1 Tax=Edaphobacter sp. 12200R-103 TaxID=2703788 RepID=UPI00192EE3A6|nr:hypothetical protein [Edaphobacter sp. 12200R-103]